MAGRQVPCTARVVALDSVACGPVYTRGPFAVSTRGQRESLSQRARSSYTPPRGALSSPRGNNVGTRGGPNGQPHTAAPALPPTVPSASSAFSAYLEMMAIATAHLCDRNTHF